MTRSICVSVPDLYQIAIPTNVSFLKTWYKWTSGKVARHFKRDKERCEDTAQSVRVRLLTKDFTGRWFFKHLTDELVNKAQAERILGGISIGVIGSIPHVYGHKSSEPAGKLKDNGEPYDTSIWRVSDLLAYGKFDYERHYYSIQNHTLDSDKILRLLGYKPGEYSALESLYRQGRLRPSELTDHFCREVVRPIKKRGDRCGLCEGKHFARGYCSSHYHLSRVDRCPECDHGRELLRNRGVSLAHRWNRPDVAVAISKLRWLDTQLGPYLRDWKRKNLIKTTPEFILRPNKNMGIDAGLLRYAEMIIDHEVVNDFKRMGRSDDLSVATLNNGMSPEWSNSEVVAWDSDNDKEREGSGAQRVIRDTDALGRFSRFECQYDIQRLVESASLSDEESAAMFAVDLGEQTIRQYADEIGVPVQRVHRVLSSTHKKLRLCDTDFVAGEKGRVQDFLRSSRSG